MASSKAEDLIERLSMKQSNNLSNKESETYTNSDRERSIRERNRLPEEDLSDDTEKAIDLSGSDIKWVKRNKRSKEPRDIKIVSIGVCMTEAEKKRAEELADRYHVSYSALIRTLIRNAK